MGQTWEPETLYCTAGECLEEAAGSGYATFEVSRSAGAPDHERLLTFTLPLCPHHADLLRSANSLVEFRSPALNRDQDQV